MPSRTAPASYYDSSCGRVAEYTAASHRRSKGRAQADIPANHFVAFSPNSTRRRMASDSAGLSGWPSAHLTIDVRNVGEARKPINGLVHPREGSPIHFA